MNNDNSENEKKGKLNGLINWFKEAWKNPRKKAGLKLLGYLVFFIVFFTIAAIGNMSNNVVYYEKTPTTTTLDTQAYSYKQKLLLENKHFINYDITVGENVYKINGSIIDSVLDGYLETNEGIKKIKLENNVLYDSSSGENNIIESNINVNFIDIKTIINKVASNRAYIENKEEEKIYTYNITVDNIKCVYKVYTDKDSIYKIEITNEGSNYVLNFDI